MTNPLQNEDGLDKSYAIAVVGRFLIYRNMHRFMKDNTRILNVLASGEKLPSVAMSKFDKDVALGKRNVTSLFDAMMNFAIGNEIMIDALFKLDKHYQEKKFTMVSTHPGLLKTDLHRGQGWVLDLVEGVMVLLAGRTEEDAGIRQSSILVSEKLHPFKLNLVDQFQYGRIHDPALLQLIEMNQDWLWQFLTSLENKSSCVSDK